MDNSVASILLRIEAQLKRLADAQEAANAASTRTAEPRDPFAPARIRSFGVPHERPPRVTRLSAEETRELLQRQEHRATEDDLLMMYTGDESFSVVHTADLDRDEERKKREEAFFVGPHVDKGRRLDRAAHHGKWMARVEACLSRVRAGSVGKVAFPDDATAEGFSFVCYGEFIERPFGNKELDARVIAGPGGGLLHREFDPHPEFYDCGRWVDDRSGWLPIEELAEPFRATALALRDRTEGANVV